MKRSDSWSSMDWKPDPSQPLPLYQQIELYIRQKITSGEWAPGTRLPSQRTLAESMGINRSTLVSALDNLTAAGMIEGRHGGGTYVCSLDWNALPTREVPNWEEASEEGSYYPNLPEVQQINRSEFEPGIIRLGTGELAPELMPHDEFNEILHTLSRRSHSLNYLEPQGSLELRIALSAYLQKVHDIQASPASILIVSGSIQALNLVSVGLLPRGATVLLEKPSYLYSIHAFQSAGLKMGGIPLDDEGIQLAELSQASNRALKQGHFPLLYTIPSFHNPTGNLMSAQRREELLATAYTTGISILEDAAYTDLWLDEPVPKPLKALDREGRVLHMGTLSKAVSPGLRLGWLIGPEPVIRRLADIKMQTDYGTSSLAQEAAALWFADGYHERHMDRLRPELRNRRDCMLELLQRYLGELAQWNIPRGGFYIWLKLTCAPLSIRRLFQICLDRGVLIHPGYLYNRLDQEHLRLSYAYCTPEQMEQGLSILAETVRELLTSLEK